MSTVVEALSCTSAMGLHLALRRPEQARVYYAEGMQRYRELLGSGLPANNPLKYIVDRGWAGSTTGLRVELPIYVETGGGTRPEEVLTLASAARLLQPSKVFEIGTYRGVTTLALILNSPPRSVYSLDLPPGGSIGAEGAIDTDLELIQRREIAKYVNEQGLQDRYTQILCDSLSFDPAPHAGSVELGFIDGAHSRQYVENDTRKLAAMMARRGLVFWHDYGGRGRFAALTAFLEEIGRKVPVFRVPRTTLAWTPAEHLIDWARAAA